MSNFICFNLENFQNTNVSTGVSATGSSDNLAKTSSILAEDKISGTHNINTTAKAGNLDCSVDKNTMTLDTKKACFPKDYMTPAVNAADLKNEIGSDKLNIDKDFSDLNKEFTDLNDKPSSDLNLNNKPSSDLNNKKYSNYKIYLGILLLIIMGGAGYYYYFHYKNK